MRKFLLENSIGEVFRLDDADSFFLEPEGLGFTRDAEFQKVGNRFVVLRNNAQQPAPSGQICFGGDGALTPYQQYNAFSVFLQHQPLILHYSPDETGIAYKIEVIPVEVTKTELETMGLNVGISFAALSFYYVEFEESGETSVRINSDSLKESPCCITIYGNCANPEWWQSVNGEEVVHGVADLTVASNQRLEIHTDTDPYSILLVDNSGTVTDVYADCDFSTERFGLVEYGENIFTATDENGLPGINLSVKGRILYETV